MQSMPDTKAGCYPLAEIVCDMFLKVSSLALVLPLSRISRVPVYDNRKKLPRQYLQVYPRPTKRHHPVLDECSNHLVIMHERIVNKRPNVKFRT